MLLPASLRRRLPGKLQHQFLALFALLFGCSMLLYSIYTANEQRQLTEAYLQAQAEALSKGLALSSEEALTTGEIWVLQPMLRQAAEFPGLQHIDLTDTAGIVLASVARQGSNTLAGPTRGFSMVVPSTPRPQTFRQAPLGGADELVVWAPIGDHAAFGWVRARFSLEQAEASARLFYVDSLWAGLLVVGLTSLAFMLLLRRPMRSLQEAIPFAASLEHASGAHIGVDSGVSDIDALNQALNRASTRLRDQQTELRSAAARYRTVVEGLSEVVFETDARLALSYLNPAWQEITQRDPASCLGQPLTLYVVESERAALQKALEELLSGRRGMLRDRFRSAALDGGTRWLELAIRARRDEQGLIVGLLGWASDVTARREAEQALTAQLHFVETLVDCIPHALYVRHADGRFLSINRAFEKLFGVSRDDLTGCTEMQLPRESLLWESQQTLLRFEAGNETSGELRLHGHGGLRLDVLCRKSSLLDRDGEPAGVVVSITDISERKQAEEQMRAARDAAEAASRAKSDFLANISHEIRTPMNAILGMTQLTLETALDKEQRDYLSLVKQSADSLLSVLNDVLDFSKIEAGQLSFDTIAFRFRDCLSDALRTFAPQAAGKGLRLDMDIAPEVPEAAIGDPNRLRQVLLNLLSNAIKFTTHGEIHVAVDVLTRARDNLCVRIAVSDTGIGIPAAQQESVFDAFAQADSSITRKYGGTGLGLTIAARLVAGMGGRIWLESEAGQGSTFFFTVTVRSATAAALLERPRADGLPESTLRPLRLLLAEDNPVNQTLARRLLGKLGHQVDAVGNGAEAVSAARTGGYDAILMDVQMPEMSGLDATRAIRSEEIARNAAPVPIIAMTAHAMAGDRARCLEAGMNAYLTKPIILEALIGELARVVPGADGALPASADGQAIAAALSPQENVMSFDRPWMLEQIGGDVELMHDVIRVFLNDYPRLIANLHQDFAAGELPALQSSAHALKGAVGNFGALAAVNAALALEQAAKQGDSEPIATLLAEAEAAAAELLRELEAELASGG